MVQVKQIVDHAETGNLRRGGRNEKQQEEKQRQGIALTLPRERQDYGGNGRVHPEAVGKKCQQRQCKPEIASTGEITVRDQVCRRSPCKSEDDTGKDQDDD
ncbi:hypothetical protein D9M71_609200 [compost metagenome]